MVISVVEHSGNIDESYTAIRIGKALAQKGGKTLIIDLQPEAYITKALGIKKQSGISELLKSNSTEEMVIITLDGFDIIPSDLESEFMRSSYYDTDETSLSATLTNLSNIYEHIVVDCPSDLSFVMLQCIQASDIVLTTTFKECYPHNRFQAKIMNALEELTKCQPTFILEDECFIEQINVQTGNNQRLFVLDNVGVPAHNIPGLRNNSLDAKRLKPSVEYIQKYELHLN